MSRITNLTADDTSLIHHLSFATSTFSLIVLICCISYIGYNVFIHPLKEQPGPNLWAATRIPWVWHKVRGTLHRRMLELHLQYGHTVRIAPNEVSYTTDTAWKAIYGHRPGAPEMAKDSTFTFSPINGVHGIISADRVGHARQRKLVSHAFSEKALKEQEGFLQSYVDKLIDLLSVKRQEGPLDMVRAYNFTTFDLIGDLAFGEPFGCLDSDRLHPYVAILYKGVIGIAQKAAIKYYGLSRLERMFITKQVAQSRAQNQKRADDKVDRRVERDTDRKDFMSYILAAKEDQGMTREELHTNASTLIVAGSETTATLLSGATYNLLTHSDIYDKLVREIRSSFANEVEITLQSVSGLKYMLAVLDETLRFYPPVPDTLPRIVPAGGAEIDGTFIPGGTTVGVHQSSTYRLPSNFYEPNDFMPERWLSETKDSPPFKNDNRAAVQPFSYGARNCLGKNLAYAEMRLILAKVLWNFDLELEEGNKGWQEKQRAYLIWEKSPLMCRLTPVGKT